MTLRLRRTSGRWAGQRGADDLGCQPAFSSRSSRWLADSTGSEFSGSFRVGSDADKA